MVGTEVAMTYNEGYEAGLAEGLGLRDELRAGLDSPSPQIAPSAHLGKCGHPLDAWETHLEHRPDCPRELCLEDRCDCPEVCPDCCRACGYDLAERMGS